MKRKKLTALVIAACMLVLSACGGTASTSSGDDRISDQNYADNPGEGDQENEDSNSQDAEGGNNFMGPFIEYRQDVADFAGTYYNFEGISFEVISSDKGVMIKGFSVPQADGTEAIVPDTPIIHDADCELDENNEIHYFYQISEYSFFDIYFVPENGHINYIYADYTDMSEDWSKPFVNVSGDFSTDSSVALQNHYYREIRVTADAGSDKIGFADCINSVNMITSDNLGVFFIDGNYEGYDDYYQFLYNTETGYVESIKLVETFTSDKIFGDSWEDDVRRKHREECEYLKEAILAEADKYNVLSVDFDWSEYQMIVTFGIDRVGKFNDPVRMLLDEKQDIERFKEAASRDLADHPELAPAEGANYVYVTNTHAEGCYGTRVEWYD